MSEKYERDGEGNELYRMTPSGEIYLLRKNGDEFYAKDKLGNEYYPGNNVFAKTITGQPIYAKNADGEIIFPRNESGDEVYIKNEFTGHSQLSVGIRYARKMDGSEVYPTFKLPNSDEYEEGPINLTYARTNKGYYCYPLDANGHEYYIMEITNHKPYDYPITNDGLYTIPEKYNKPFILDGVSPHDLKNYITGKIKLSNGTSSYITSYKALRQPRAVTKPYEIFRLDDENVEEPDEHVDNEERNDLNNKDVDMKDVGNNDLDNNINNNIPDEDMDGEEKVHFINEVQSSDAESEESDSDDDESKDKPLVLKVTSSLVPITKNFSFYYILGLLFTILVGVLSWFIKKRYFNI